MTSTAVDALRRTLGAEHAAIYGYGVVGARLTGAGAAAALAAYDAHRARRDRLVALLARAGGEPVPAEPAYALPSPVTDAAAAVRLAGNLELGVAACYADLVAAGADALRALAATALQEAAVRAASWRGRGVPFPGLPERA